MAGTREDVVNKILRGVEEAEKLADEALQGISSDAAELMKHAEKLAARIKEKSRQLAEQARKEIMEIADAEVEKMRRELEEKGKRDEQRLLSMIEANREKALEAALEALAKVIKG